MQASKVASHKLLPSDVDEPALRLDDELTTRRRAVLAVLFVVSGPLGVTLLWLSVAPHEGSAREEHLTREEVPLLWLDPARWEAPLHA